MKRIDQQTVHGSEC